MRKRVLTDCLNLRPRLLLRAMAVASAGLFTFWVAPGLCAQQTAVQPNDNTPAPAEGSESRQQRIAQLIEQLGSNDYSQRESAESELAAVGLDAFEALQAASGHRDLEIASRAAFLLSSIPKTWVEPSDSQEVAQLMRRFESGDLNEQMVCFHELAQLMDAGGLAALCRIVRYDRMPFRAKYAALEALQTYPPESGAWQARMEVIERSLGPSQNAAAKWLRGWAQLHLSPAEAVAVWQLLTEEELTGFNRGAKDTNPEFVLHCIYMQAGAQRAAGQIPQAEETAAQARRFQPNMMQLHRRIMQRLYERGQLWESEQESLELIARETDTDMAVVLRRRQAELFHDAGNEKAAQEILLPAVDLLTQKPLPPTIRRSGPPPEAKELQARIAFFASCEARQAGDEAKRLALLWQAIDLDIRELDCLIDLHKLVPAEGEERNKLTERIQLAANSYRTEIGQDRSNPSPYNQLAWLLANTLTNTDEALELAQKAVELDPQEASYLDTLAHCQFAKGQLEEALASQRKAVAANPQSVLMRAALARFEEAAAAAPKPDGPAP